MMSRYAVCQGQASLKALRASYAVLLAPNRMIADTFSCAHHTNVGFGAQEEKAGSGLLLISEYWRYAANGCQEEDNIMNGGTDLAGQLHKVLAAGARKNHDM